jgi:hypothetical protein
LLLATVGEGDGRIQARESRFRPAAARFRPAAARFRLAAAWVTPGGGGGCPANRTNGRQRALGVRVLFGSGLFPCPRRIAAVPAAYRIYFYFFLNWENRVCQGYVYQTRIGRIGDVLYADTATFAISVLRRLSLPPK